MPTDMQPRPQSPINPRIFSRSKFSSPDDQLRCIPVAGGVEIPGGITASARAGPFNEFEISRAEIGFLFQMGDRNRNINSPWKIIGCLKIFSGAGVAPVVISAQKAHIHPR